MFDNTSIGWIISLSDNENSDWGELNSFYESMISCKIKGGILKISSDTWGKLQRKDFTPRSGDGFAFYHTSRAQYNYDDKYNKRPRISLMGVIETIDFDRQDVRHISVVSHESILKALNKNPIVRNEETKNLFIRSGIVPGAVASFYKADLEVWAQLKALLKNRVSIDKFKGV